MRLHDWIRELAFFGAGIARRRGWHRDPSTAVLRDGTVNVGAHVIGPEHVRRRTGPWGDDPWNGWWGENPPFHVPVFVVTHHARPPLECEGGTTFTFVTTASSQPWRRRERSRPAATSRSPAGRPLRARLLRCRSVSTRSARPLSLSCSAAAFGFRGRRRPPDFEQISVSEGRGVTHLTYRFRAG